MEGKDLGQLAISATDCPLSFEHLCGALPKEDNPKFNRGAHTGQSPRTLANGPQISELKDKSAHLFIPLQPHMRNMDQEHNYNKNSNLERGGLGDL